MSTQSEFSNPFLTVKEYAALMRLHPMTVYRHVEEGRLKVARVGSRIRILKRVEGPEERSHA